MERLGHFDGTVPSLACNLTKQQGLRGGIPLETPGNAISETLIFKISLDASALKKLYAFGASSKAAYYSLSACYLKYYY